MGSSIQGVWFSSWYVVSIDTGHIAHSPLSGPTWSSAFQMEPVLSVSSFNEPKSEPLLQKVYRPVFSFENEIIISFSFCCPHIPESLPQAQLKPNYLLSLICLFVHVSVILTALRLRCGALASLVITLRLSCPVACGILVP